MAPAAIDGAPAAIDGAPAAIDGAPRPDAVPSRVPGPPARTPAALAARNADQEVRYVLRVAAGYAWRLIVVAVAVYGIFVFLGRIQLVGVAVFVGLVISALLRPIADRLSLVLPRGPAVALSLLLGIALVAGVFTFIASSVAGQSATLAAQFGNGVNEIERWLRNGPFHMSSAQLGGGIEQARGWIAAHQGTLVGQALGQAGVALEVLAGLALSIFCSIFFINGGDRMWVWFLGQTPPSVREKIDLAGRAGWETFAGYTRGILIVAATNASLVCLALLVLRVPLAFPLALLVFFASFIPIIGAPLALAVATVVALAGRGPLIAVFVLVLIVLIGQLEGHVLQPLVMSRAVAIHPVVVAISVACGTVLAGIIGAVVAVPLVSVAWAVRRTLRSINA
jgi:predicted PurR-regulated permease PerM